MTIVIRHKRPNPVKLVMRVEVKKMFEETMAEEEGDEAQKYKDLAKDTAMECLNELI